MPVYVFEARDGRQVEREFPMGGAPRAIKVLGDTYRRIIQGVTVGRVPEAPTDSERDELWRQKQYLESRADEVLEGSITIKHGKHRVRAFDPEIKNKPLGNRR